MSDPKPAGLPKPRKGPYPFWLGGEFKREGLREIGWVMGSGSR